jgi:hypothetical protein
MNKDLQKRLGKYTAAAAALVGATGANAQIVYTDVNPDFAHPGNEVGYGLDLNNDANFDFALFSLDTTLASGNRIRNTVVAPYGTAAASNAIAGEAPSGYDYALALNNGDMIDNTLNWIAATNTMAYNVNSANPYNENWNGVTDKYLGLKFVVAGNTHFGWARLDVLAIGDIWTLKDYAFNASPNTGLTAGQMTGVSTMAMESLVHFVNQPNNTVKVVVNGGLTEGAITLVSATGQTVSTGNVDSDQYIVDLNGLAAGIYVINAEFAEGSMTKKVIVH